MPYWTRKDLRLAKSNGKVTAPGQKRRRGKTAMINGENPAMDFITDAEGIPIDPERADYIRKLFRSKWLELAN